MDEAVINMTFAILGILGSAIGGYLINDLRYKKGKKILGEVRKLFDAVDDAVYDDTVTEAEFRKVWENLKGIYAAVMT